MMLLMVEIIARIIGFLFMGAAWHWLGDVGVFAALGFLIIVYFLFRRHLEPGERLKRLNHQ